MAFSYGDPSTNSNSFYSDNFNETFEDPYLLAPLKQILITVYTAIFALSFFGNILVIYVIARNKSMHTVTNFFLANLALADLLVALFCVIPQLLWYVLVSWPLGKTVCRLHKYMISATTAASILILTVISVERYIAILHPLETRQVLTTRRLTIVVMLVWILSAVVNIPLAFFYDVVEFTGTVYCMVTMSLQHAQIHSMIIFFFFYVLPVIIMSVLYGIISRKLWTTSTGKRVFTSDDDGGGMKRGRGSRFTSRFTGRFTKSKTTGDVNNSTNAPGNIYRPDSDQTETVVLDLGRGQKDEESMAKSKLNEIEAESDGTRNKKIGPFYVDEPEDDTALTDTECKAPLVREGTNNNVNGTRKELPLVSQGNKSNSRIGRSQIKRGNDDITGGGQSGGKRRSNVMAARKRVIRLLVVIVVSFALCLLPAQLQVLFSTFGYQELFHTTAGIVFQPFSHAIYFFNSALNPFLYAFFSDNFRRKFQQTLHPRRRNTRACPASRTGVTRLPSMTSCATTEVVTVCA